MEGGATDEKNSSNDGRIETVRSLSCKKTGPFIVCTAPPMGFYPAAKAIFLILAMSSSEKTPFTPEMAASFIPCFRPSL